MAWFSSGLGNRPTMLQRELFESHYDRTVRAATVILQDRSIAEESVQEAFVRAFENLSSLKKPEKFGSWVLTIALNVGRSLFKERARFWPTDAPERHMEPAASGGANLVEAEVERSLSIQATRKALGQLRIQEREVLVLHYWNELTIEEIADYLVLREGTVKSRLHRARQHLRRVIQDAQSHDTTTGGLIK